MNALTTARLLILVCIIFLCSACTNLQAVRDFTSESAQLSGYAGIVDYSLEGFSRSEAYLLPDIRTAEKAADAARQDSRVSLIRLQELSSAYMTTLAKLAGADSFDVDRSVNKLAKSIKASPELGVQSTTVDAYANLVNTISNWVLAGAQNKAVRDMIRDGGGDFEQIMSGMGDVVRILHKVHENEKRTVINSLETMILTTKNTSENYLMLALARDRLYEKRAFYARGDALYDAAARGIHAIQDGHRTMTENLHRLGAKEVVNKLKQLQNDIKDVRHTLAGAGV